jgi:hypothetical protein
MFWRGVRRSGELGRGLYGGIQDVGRQIGEGIESGVESAGQFGHGWAQNIGDYGRRFGHELAGKQGPFEEWWQRGEAAPTKQEQEAYAASVGKSAPTAADDTESTSSSHPQFGNMGWDWHARPGGIKGEIKHNPYNTGGFDGIYN